MLILPIFILAFLLQLFLPWWSIGLAAFSISFWLATSGRKAFWGSFGGVALLWMVVSLWKSLPNENLLANRIGQMFMIPAGNFNWIIVLAATCLIGGLAAGLAGLSGYLSRSAFWHRTDK